jgi:hypothetical protein
MQLCCELKKHYLHIIQKCYQLGALMLVLLFLSINVVQVFHHHQKAVQTEVTDNDQDTVSASDLCQLCDYLMHKQGKELFFIYPPVDVFQLPEPVCHTTSVFVGNYKFTLQGFTNKGPPANSI